MSSVQHLLALGAQLDPSVTVLPLLIHHLPVETRMGENSPCFGFLLRHTHLDNHAHFKLIFSDCFHATRKVLS